MQTNEAPSKALAASIVISTWNRPALLPGAVRSALAALPENSEIVVTDDQSDPPASGLLQAFPSDVVRVVVNDGPRGASANRNFGVACARGAVIFFLDDDDEMRVGYPAAVLEMLRVGRATWGFSTVAPVSDSPSAFSSPVVPRNVESLPFRKRLGGLGCGFWISRGLFDDVGGIDETLSINEDTEFSLRLLAAGHKPAISADPGVFVRRHKAGLTATSSPAERARCFRAIIERHAGFLAERPDASRHLRRRLLKMLAKDGRAVEGWYEALAGQSPRDFGYFLAVLAIARLRN